jgi:hypothetical protein
MRKVFKQTRMNPRQKAVLQLAEIPGVGNSIANDLWNIGITSIADLKGRDPKELYDLSNKFAGAVQDPCLLYVFRCAVYYANTDKKKQDPEKLKWWNWK